MREKIKKNLDKVDTLRGDRRTYFSQIPLDLINMMKDELKSELNNLLE